MTSAYEFLIHREGMDYRLELNDKELSAVLFDGEENIIGEFKRKPFSLGTFVFLVGEKDYIFKHGIFSTLVSPPSGVIYSRFLSTSFKDSKTKNRVTKLEFVGIHMGIHGKYQLLVQDTQHVEALLLTACIDIHFDTLA